MRDDMFKVIVERPRRKPWASPKTARAYRNSEQVPTKIGIRKGYDERKWLNENLAPLQRWLESQVNRPWDKVYAELAANIDRRNTVQEHIFAHIDQLVERKTRFIDGEVFVMQRWPRAGLVPIRESRATLYVHPKTGILRFNKHRVTRAQAKREAAQRANDELSARQRNLSETEQLRKIDGIWYRVLLATLPEGYASENGQSQSLRWHYPRRWDVVLRKMVSRNPRESVNWPYLYAVEKQQLSQAELRRHQLTNDADDNAGGTRRFLLCGRFAVRFSQQPAIAALTTGLRQTRITVMVIAARVSGHMHGLRGMLPNPSSYFESWNF
jgi:hypothetical protein